MKAFIIALLFSIGTAQASNAKLTQYEQGAVDAGALVGYQLALGTLDVVDEISTGTEPYICWPFPVAYEEFHLLVEDNVTTRLSQMSKPERKALDMGYVVRQALIEEFGCYE